MAVGRTFNWRGQMRVDVSHLRAVESSIIYDFDTLAGQAMAGGLPYVLTGFEIASWSVGMAPTSLQVVTAGSVAFHYPASENGTMLFVPSDRSPETLSGINARVSGSFTANSTNYVGFDFVRQADDTTSDIVQFLDATTLTTSPKTIPLGRTLDYVIRISTTPFSADTTICPIAKVVTDANNLVTSVTDARTMYFRLANGGDSPNPLGVFPWSQGRAVENAQSFTGGDKVISNEKEWKSAIMQRLWEVTGGEYWYSNVTDRNIKFMADPAVAALHTRLSITNNVIHAGGVLSWSGLKVLLDNSTGAINNIVDDTVGVAIADGDVIYVELNRYVDGSNLTATKVTQAQYNALPAPTRVGSRYILFWAKTLNGTTRVYSRLDWLSVGQYSGAATNSTYGVVKTNSTDAVVSGPFAVIADANGGKAVASGLSRGTLGAGTLAIGTANASDTTINIGNSSASLGSRADAHTWLSDRAGASANTDFWFDTTNIRVAGNLLRLSVQSVDAFRISWSGTTTIAAQGVDQDGLTITSTGDGHGVKATCVSADSGIAVWGIGGNANGVGVYGALNGSGNGWGGFFAGGFSSVSLPDNADSGGVAASGDGSTDSSKAGGVGVIGSGGAMSTNSAVAGASYGGHGVIGRGGNAASSVSSLRVPIAGHGLRGIGGEATGIAGIQFDGHGVYATARNATGGSFGSTNAGAINLNPRAAAPTVANDGDMYYNSTNGHFYGYSTLLGGWRQLDN